MQTLTILSHSASALRFFPYKGLWGPHTTPPSHNHHYHHFPGSKIEAQKQFQSWDVEPEGAVLSHMT